MDCPSFCEDDGGSGIDCPFLASFQTFHSEGNGPLSEETYMHFPKAKSIDLPDNLSHEPDHKQILDKHLSLDVFGNFGKGLLAHQIYTQIIC